MAPDENEPLGWHWWNSEEHEVRGNEPRRVVVSYDDGVATTQVDYRAAAGHATITVGNVRHHLGAGGNTAAVVPGISQLGYGLRPCDAGRGKLDRSRFFPRFPTARAAAGSSTETHLQNSPDLILTRPPPSPPSVSRPEF